MLNITAQRSAEGAKSYFAKSDYYAQGQEITGAWGGKGAVLLGLFGQVDKRAFDALCDNCNPRTGEKLTALTRGQRRVGYDFTWSAPKSISIVHALTGDERIVSAFRDSIRDTMAEMEVETEARVRKGGEDFDRPTGNLLYSEFIHLTSRPVNGLPAPQLHAHCFVMNATFDAAESRWKAAQLGRIKGNGFYWQAVQQARFASALQTLGYGVRRTKDAFEIEAVPPSAIQKFSLRTQVIERTALKLGITDAKAKSKLAATTREAKRDDIAYPELVSRWQEMLDSREREAIDGARDKPKAATDQAAAHVQFAMDHEFERSSVVEERRLLARALRHGMGEVTPEAVRAAADRQGLLKRIEQGKSWVTTPAVLAEERAMLRFAVAGKGTCSRLAPADGPWREALGHSPLSAEQQAAVAHLLTSNDRVIILRGRAGTGKTTLTTTAVREVIAHGTPVVIAAPTVKAVEVLKGDGFGEAATLARLLVDQKLQEKGRGGVLWVDEAGLIGSRAMAGLFALAEKIDARVVLAGDTRQLAAVDRGSPLRVLEDLGGLPVAEVKEIRRQQHRGYRKAVKLLAEGNGEAALAQLDTMGCIKLLPVWDRYEPLAKEYAERLEAATPKERDHAALIVCPSHAEGAMINDAVRSELRRRGLIGGEERLLPRLVPLQWTAAERGDAGQYDGAEVVQFHRNSGAFKAGERVNATEAIRHGATGRPEHFAAYATSSIAVAKGDLLRATAKGKSSDGTHCITNGSVYRVAGFDRSGDLLLSNGWKVSKGFAHWTHDYVNTAYASQGRTVKHVIVASSAMSAAAASKEAFYVAASRGRDSVSIYCDDRRSFAEAVSKSQARPTATELAGTPKPNWWQRMRQAMANVQLAASLAAKAAWAQIAPRQRELAYER